MNTMRKCLMATCCLLFFSAILHVTDGKLVGDHICITNESYPVNVTEHHVRNATVRNYQWCMNYPPRCSYYTIKQINHTIILEVNETRTVEKCCKGYQKVDDHCLPNCETCKNGICASASECQCFPGYQGVNCSTRCSEGFYGINCSKKCSCTNNHCNPIDGVCIIDENEDKDKSLATTEETYDLTTIEFVESETEATTDISTLKLSILTTDGRSVKSPFNFTKTIENNTVPTILPATTATTLASTLQSTGKSVAELFNVTKSVSNSGFTSTTDALTLRKPIQNSVKHNNTSFIVSSSNDNNTVLKIFSTTSTTEDTTVWKSLLPYVKNKAFSNITVLEITTENQTLTLNTNRKNLNENYYLDSDKIIPVGIKYDKISDKESTTYGLPVQTEEKNFLVIDKNDKMLVSLTENNLTSVLSIVTASVVALLILMTTLYVLSKARKNKQNHGKRDLNRKSLVTASIFHTPLPDPPIVENPSYHLSRDESMMYPSEVKIFENCIVYTLRPPSLISKDHREYLYDHPPSTGSYRAASVVEPADIELGYHQAGAAEIEPVYDEIPHRDYNEEVAKTGPTDNNTSLYMNTCGTTKL